MGEGGQWKDRIAGLLQKRQAATAMGGDEKLAQREADGKRKPAAESKYSLMAVRLRRLVSLPVAGLIVSSLVSA